MCETMNENFYLYANIYVTPPSRFQKRNSLKTCNLGTVMHSWYSRYGQNYHAKLPPGIAYLFRYRNLNKFITSMLSKFRLFCFLNVYNNTQFSLLYHLKFWKNTILFFFLRENIDSVSFWHFLETCGNFRSKIWL